MSAIRSRVIGVLHVVVVFMASRAAQAQAAATPPTPSPPAAATPEPSTLEVPTAEPPKADADVKNDAPSKSERASQADATPLAAQARAEVNPAEKPALEIVPLGYVEAHLSYNTNRPSNGITNYRGFDNRHATFTLANAVLGARWATGPVSGRVVLQVGATPSAYYAGEPGLAGSGGANASSAELWKYIQEAYVAYKAPLGRGLVFQLGLCGSPIGYESFAVKDNWNYSRSNLFFGLPFYHAGIRATYEWTDRIATTISVFNGWNSVVDSNEAKSIQSTFVYKIPDRLLLQFVYFGGIERTTGAPEGPYWRHHFDAVAQVDATSWLSFAAQGDHGWEPNRIGTARWTAGALYTRVAPTRWLYVALRGDRFHEHLATNDAGMSSASLFWGGVEWVSSGTATLDVRPHDHVSIRLEGRHDVADTPLYFGRNVPGDGGATPYVPNARTQDTILLGATTWF